MGSEAMGQVASNLLDEMLRIVGQHKHDIKRDDKYESNILQQLHSEGIWRSETCTAVAWIEHRDGSRLSSVGLALTKKNRDRAVYLSVATVLALELLQSDSSYLTSFVACRESQGVFGVRFSSGQLHDPQGAELWKRPRWGFHGSAWQPKRAAVFGREPKSRRQHRSFGGQQQAVSIRSVSPSSGRATVTKATLHESLQNRKLLGVWMPPILIVRWKEML
ncbi:unnamed protein product [Symbiodinium sp. CCMP2592]|nr:unnamed protein product [Symbiodinium sp. CCMP2592]